jgi:hypothetical protein
MKIGNDTTLLVDTVQKFSGGKVANTAHIAQLIELSEENGREQIFDDLIFHAKFLSKLYGVMKHTDPGSEAFPKLKTEFTEAVERVGTLIRTLVKEAPQEVKQDFRSRYFEMNHHCLNNLIQFSYDLSWVKNWKIDTEKNRTV